MKKTKKAKKVKVLKLATLQYSYSYECPTCETMSGKITENTVTLRCSYCGQLLKVKIITKEKENE